MANNTKRVVLIKTHTVFSPEIGIIDKQYNSFTHILILSEDLENFRSDCYVSDVIEELGTVSIELLRILGLKGL